MSTGQGIAMSSATVNKIVVILVEKYWRHNGFLIPWWIFNAPIIEMGWNALRFHWVGTFYSMDNRIKQIAHHII